MTLDLVVNDVYEPLIDAKETYLELMGGRGSGKSHFVFKQLVPIWCLRQPYKVVAMRKVAATIRLSVWPALLEGISNFGLTNLVEINKTEKEIRFPWNGSVISCAGADDPEKLKSLEGYDAVVQEEATEFNENDNLNIDAAIKSKKKKIVYLHNPIPITPNFSNYLKATFWDKNNPDSIALKTTYRDNIRFLPEKYIARLESLKDTNPKLWNMWANGNYTTLEGVIFENWDTVPFVPTEGGIKDIGYGLDFGFTVDPATLIKVWARGLGTDNAEIWLREDIYETGLNNQALASKMRFVGVEPTDEIMADSSEPKSIDEIHKAGFNIHGAIKGPDSVRSGIDQMQGMRIHILQGSTNLIKEFSTYSWKKDKDGKSLPEPEDSFNHAIDAVRYRVTSRANIVRWGVA
ncbi:MAG: PBSX family phage terminase large subunit [Patescibacteria group bacterium]